MKTKSKYVKSETLYSPQAYCEKMTGHCYCFNQDDTVGEIEAILKHHGLEAEVWSYPLYEIDHIVENELSVVLVDVSGFDKQGIWRHEYRWFEVFEDFEEDEEETE